MVSTSLGWDTTTSAVANTFTSALSFCSITEGGFGTWILMVSGQDSGYCWNTCGQTAGQAEQGPGQRGSHTGYRRSKGIPWLLQTTHKGSNLLLGPSKELPSLSLFPRITVRINPADTSKDTSSINARRMKMLKTWY